MDESDDENRKEAEEALKEHFERLEEEYFEPMGEEGIERAIELVTAFSEGFQNDWGQIRDRHYNPSRKGSGYEETLKEFLEQYFDSILDFRTGCAIVDSELRCFKSFDDRQNEFDVVATYQTATPNIVFEEQGMYWVPYDGVGFICEVKSNLTKSNLEKDLSKVQKLVELRTEPNKRFTRPAKSSEAVTHQIHCLVYDENSISDKSRRELFKQYPDAWDMVLVVDEDKLYINSTLPYSKSMFDSGSSGTFEWAHINNGLLWFITTLSVSLPYPEVVHTINPILKMATFHGISTGGGHFSH